MLRSYLEQRHIDLDSGRSCLALEDEYWQALEVLAFEDSWNDWPVSFVCKCYHSNLKTYALASNVQEMVLQFC